MARSRSAVAMAFVLVVALVAMQRVPSALAACGNIQSLAACLGAASKGTVPTPNCCSAMAAFAQGGTVAGDACLCQAISNPTAKAAGAQMQYAILIPQKCKLNYKAGYVCKGLTVPGGHA